MKKHLRQQIRSLEAQQLEADRNELRAFLEPDDFKHELAKLKPVSEARLRAALKGLPEVVEALDGPDPLVTLAAAIAALPDSKDTLTPPQAAQRLGVSPDSIVYAIRSGKLKAVNTSKGHKPRYRISQQALDEYLNGTPEKPKRRKKKRPCSVNLF